MAFKSFVHDTQPTSSCPELATSSVYTLFSSNQSLTVDHTSFDSSLPIIIFTFAQRVIVNRTYTLLHTHFACFLETTRRQNKKKTTSNSWQVSLYLTTHQTEEVRLNNEQRRWWYLIFAQSSVFITTDCVRHRAQSTGQTWPWRGWRNLEELWALKAHEPLLVEI